MFYKVTSGLFMAATAVFASLYFVEKTTPASTVVTSSTEHKRSSNNDKAPELRNDVADKNRTITKTETVILKQVVSSHPDLSSHEIDLMLEIKNSMSRDYSRRLEREHPMLFERLQLDEEQKRDFKLLVGERRLGLNMRAPEGLTEEEREDYYAKKQEILDSIDGKIADSLGSQFDSYLNYRDRSQQYQVVFDINRRLNSSGEEMNVEQQDQLAALMYDSRKDANGESNRVDWRSMQNNPEKAAGALEEYKVRHENIKAQADFLSENQRKAFVAHLDSRYKRYESWVKRLSEGRDSDRSRDRR